MLYHNTLAKSTKNPAFLNRKAGFIYGGEGNRTPVLDTVDASISMFRRGLLLLAGDPLRVSLSP